MPPRPLCFVLMPFGSKKDPVSQANIDFDAVYLKGIKPAIEAAGMEPIRADEELAGGIIHKPMFERLLLCDYAVADLTTGNANVYYEMGVRHAARPATTVAIFQNQQRLPFDLQYLRAMPYDGGAENRFGDAEGAKLTADLSAKLIELRDAAKVDPLIDSPLFQLLGEYRAPDISRLKTDVFREQVAYSESVKSRIAAARAARDANALAAIEAGLGPFDAVEVGVLVDLYLSWRALSNWDNMIALYDKLPAPLQRSVMVREQLGFALNRKKRREEALKVLEDVVAQQAPSSETCGLIGRIYKDQWTEALKAGEKIAARGHLNKAIDAYLRGFECDSRDAYPGVNAVTLLEIRADEKSIRRKDELVPVVTFAVTQRLKGGKPDYWDHATLLELHVLGNQEDEAMDSLANALAAVRELWEPETSANNLAMIRDARAARGVAQPWLDDVIGELLKRAGK